MMTVADLIRHLEALPGDHEVLFSSEETDSVYRLSGPPSLDDECSIVWFDLMLGATDG